MQECGRGDCGKGEEMLCAQPPNALFTQPTTSDGILIIIRKHTHTNKEKEAVGDGESAIEMGTRTHVE